MPDTTADTIIKWSHENKERLAEIQITPEIVAYTPGEFATLDLHSAGWSGRMTVWSAGQCDVEAIDDNLDQITWTHYENVGEKLMLDYLATLVNQIACNNSSKS